MDHHESSSPRTVTATVQDILPNFGLAFAVDAEQVEWGITCSTEGPGFATLRTGQVLKLVLQRHGYVSLVSRYERAS